MSIIILQCQYIINEDMSAEFDVPYLYCPLQTCFEKKFHKMQNTSPKAIIRIKPYYKCTKMHNKINNYIN